MFQCVATQLQQGSLAWWHLRFVTPSAIIPTVLLPASTHINSAAILNDWLLLLQISKDMIILSKLGDVRNILRIGIICISPLTNLPVSSVLSCWVPEFLNRLLRIHQLCVWHLCRQPPGPAASIYYGTEMQADGCDMASTTVSCRV